ncbi:MAG: 3-oxoacyl-ACP reductase FabG [Pseudomonadota bacterium]|jgi:3-oxoacyl-[acyl-carrier protein] reductase|nr:3-oxoacyl-ACP reductase FabG [Pseudomonadota bacterium]
MSIAGKVALVTGATRGIGRAIAVNLAAQGALVIGTATSEKGADTISAYLAELANRGRGLVLDVADAASVEAVLKQIQADYGTIQILVNNAGITRDNILMRMKEDEWDAVLNTNLTSVYRLVKGCLRGMSKARWGRIISVSSVVASMGNAGQANYAAAKSGMEGFTRAVAREVGSRNITVNCVAPGFIDTDMTAALAEPHRQTLQAQIPLNRLGQPEEVAAVVGFLAGDGGAYISGDTIHVNGGMYMA